ncbi:5-formyltetrahydrofolate cyclo-ligase [Methyloraptor flagellatus]|uniref:5-formyltetrahydrofolate cyclo-ligase n=1 Tax=Methyloraptor flagellatus TaxID=3162530 RepID=A0AAU7XAP8_9HYPH
MTALPVGAAEPSDPASIKLVKAAVRAEALGRRDTLPPEYRAAVTERLLDFLDALGIPAGARVSGFWPICSEIDPRGLMRALAARGHALGLPVILPDRTTMIFRRWSIGGALEAAGFGLSVPPASEPEIRPDVMLVPLAAFDRRGFRIGYGRGYYDRAIERIERDGPVLKIGLAFAAQEVPAVPIEAHDQALDFVLTENGPIACTPAVSMQNVAGEAR